MGSQMMFYISIAIKAVVLCVSIIPFALSSEVETNVEVVPSESTETTKNERISITRVSHTPAEIHSGDQSVIRFVLSAQARVEVDIYNREDYLVHQIRLGKLAVGEHQANWDGSDLDGNFVPSGVYTYTITATELTNNDGQRVVYDLSDSTGGVSSIVEDIQFNRSDKRVYFRPVQPAVVLLRAGLRDGMLLKTLVNVRAHGPSQQSVAWDGWGSSNLINLSNHPKLNFAAESWTLPDNAILVSSDTPKPSYIKPSSSRRSNQVIPPGRNVHYYYERSGGRDVDVEVAVVGAAGDRVHSLSGPTDFRVTVAEHDIPFIHSQRYEVVFFLNGTMLYENETAYTPFTWNWDPSTLPKGEHILTAVISTFSGYFGTASIKIVTPGQSSNKGEDGS